MNPEKTESLFCLQAVSLWVSYYTLLNSNGFCQVSGFIHVTAASHCHIVGEQLQRNDCQRIGKVRIGLGDVYYIIRRLLMALLPSMVTAITKAPLAFTSTILLMVFWNRSGWVAKATTSVPSSIREIVPCFSSPAA